MENRTINEAICMPGGKLAMLLKDKQYKSIPGVFISNIREGSTQRLKQLNYNKTVYARICHSGYHLAAIAGSSSGQGAAIDIFDATREQHVYTHNYEHDHFLRSSIVSPNDQLFVLFYARPGKNFIEVFDMRTKKSAGRYQTSAEWLRGFAHDGSLIGQENGQENGSARTIHYIDPGTGAQAQPPITFNAHLNDIVEEDADTFIIRTKQAIVRYTKKQAPKLHDDAPPAYPDEAPARQADGREESKDGEEA
jgi:hypothetical protein